jgi:CRP-like cAMP-binding protein
VTTLALALSRCPLFEGLDEVALEDLSQRVVVQHIAGGTAVFERGDPGDALYLLLRGRLKVLVPGEAGRIVVVELEPGDHVGEFALLSDKPRSASVVATRDCELGRLALRRTTPRR